MYTTYILESSKEMSYYIGHAEDVNARLQRHNKGYVRSTKNKRPWKLFIEKNFLPNKKRIEQNCKSNRIKVGMSLKS